MGALGRLIGTILGTSIIPFIFSFIGALIGNKIGAWIAAVICGILLLFGDIRDGKTNPIWILLVIICCIAQAFFCSWLVQKIKNYFNKNNLLSTDNIHKRKINTESVDLIRTKKQTQISNQFLSASYQQKKVHFGNSNRNKITCSICRRCLPVKNDGTCFMSCPFCGAIKKVGAFFSKSTPLAVHRVCASIIIAGLLLSIVVLFIRWAIEYYSNTQFGYNEILHQHSIYHWLCFVLSLITFITYLIKSPQGYSENKIWLLYSCSVLTISLCAIVKYNNIKKLFKHQEMCFEIICEFISKNWLFLAGIVLVILISSAKILFLPTKNSINDSKYKKDIGVIKLQPKKKLNNICPACGQEFDIPDSMAGCKVECTCGNKWIV